MKLNEVLVYVGSFRVFDMQIAIAIFTYPGVEFWPGDQRIVLVFFETNALLGIEKALRNKICTVEPRFNEITMVTRYDVISSRWSSHF